MLELIASSIVMYGNPSIWAPNTISTSPLPGDEQLYEPLQETIVAQSNTRRDADER